MGDTPGAQTVAGAFFAQAVVGAGAVCERTHDDLWGAPSVQRVTIFRGCFWGDQMRLLSTRLRLIPTRRDVQGVSIVLGSLLATALVLAAATAWGPHHCKLAFPMAVGCAMGNYESLAGGMLAAGAALFAGWLAWSAVQTQIATEERRATAENVEVEAVLQGDLDYLAEGLSSVWKILLAIDTAPSLTPDDVRPLLEGVIYGIEKIANADWLSTSRKMVELLGWKRRRYYDDLFEGIERIGLFRNIDKFDVNEALNAVRNVSDYFELLNPSTARYFEGLWRRSPKAWTLGYAISVHAGLYHIQAPNN